MNMSGAHKPEKEPLGLQVERALHYRLKKAAHMQGIHVSELVKEILEMRFGHIKLSEWDQEVIENATEQARREKRRTATPFFEE